MTRPKSSDGETGAAAPSETSAGPGTASSGDDSGNRKPAPVGELAPAKKSVVRLGSVGTLSGPVGSNTGPMLQGIQVWNKAVNARGGVNGHLVEIIVADDGGDPARHRALTQDLVENKHVLAFIANPEPLTGESKVEYVTEKRIPVIGITGGEAWAYKSPMYFPQSSSGQALTDSFYASFAQQSLPKGKERLGVISCSEIQLCRDFYDQAEAQASRRGMQLVYRARIALAQPDFTAECLAARNAGVEVLFVGADGSTLRRAAASCVRQGYRPTFASGCLALRPDHVGDANLNNSLISNAVTFPQFQANTPATAEFQAAMKQYSPGVQLAGIHTTAWTAGKLFERATAKLPEPPTTEAILRGLWAIQNDDLGGITQPLTFNEGKPSVPRVCWWNIVIKDSVYASPDGFTRTCDS
jgi:ABC-type branched-subunit amino acid transport system substrate-binding protein